jgi:hypothetical protein
MTDRYDTRGNPEDKYYPGTAILINLEVYSRCRRAAGARD